jgi:serine/threonine protein kinase
MSSASSVSTSTTVDDFVATVRKSGIVREEQLNTFLSTTSFDNPIDLAKAMEARKLITSFQRKTLLAGKYRGLLLGPYKIMEPIGKGGMGSIYLAEHCTLQRQVAIKVLPIEKARNAELLQRFYREARAAAALDHPNIVKLFDVSQGAGTHFLVLEYVAGKNLQQLVTAHGPLPYQKVVPFLMQTARGLQHAHEKGFVHRDIKPDNIVLSKDGVIKILDMGLARSLEAEQDNVTKQMNPNAIYGSVDYVSPEQSIGGKVDARSDLYSLGATAFALITGRAPYQGTSAQVLVSHQMEVVPDMSRVRAGVPPELSAIITKLMSKKPEHRYQSASEVIDALMPWMPVEGSGVSALSQGPPSSVVTTRELKPISSVAARPTQETQVSPAVSMTTTTNKKFKKKKKEKGLSSGVVLGIVIGVLSLAGILIVYMIMGNKSSTMPYDDRASKAPPPAKTNNSSNNATSTNYVTKNPPLQIDDSRCVFLDFADKANVVSTANIFAQTPVGYADNISLASWGRVKLHGIPFSVIDPKGTTVRNMFVFEGGDDEYTKARPNSLTLSCNTAAKKIYLLSGLSGWAWPFNNDRSVSLFVRLQYKDGTSEQHDLANGTHFADWRQPHSDAPAAPVIVQYDNERHLRYITIEPKKKDEIREIEFVKGPNQRTAPMLFAVTVEKP